MMKQTNGGAGKEKRSVIRRIPEDSKLT